VVALLTTPRPSTSKHLADAVTGRETVVLTAVLVVGSGVALR
jgi:hypothetical protein